MENRKAELPIQITYKYFPFLAAWDMMQIILMPGISYFSYYSVSFFFLKYLARVF
jgi:hypothetical protein